MATDPQNPDTDEEETPTQEPPSPDDDADEQQGETVDLDGDDDDVEKTDDGGAIVQIDPAEEEAEVEDTKDFYRNLATEIDESTLSTLGLDLCQNIEYDKESRKKRDEQYEEGIRRTGLGDDAPGGATFQGASKVVHPLLTEACVDFSSRMIRELLPADGPVKTFIPGKPTQERAEKAERKAACMNWQFKVQMPDFRTQLEQLSTQLPLGGSQYLRIVPDMTKKRPVPVFVPIDDVYLPYAATSFYTAERVTYVEHITQQEFENRVRNNIYREVAMTPSAMTPEPTRPAAATDKVSGKDPNGVNEDGLRDVFEVMCSIELEDQYEEEGPLPYLVSIDKDSSRVLSVVRNWEKDDDDHKPMFWMVEFPFVPWRGAYAIGLTHMIGGLSAASTGALRALLDSAHINNMPGILKLKGANFSGQSQEVSVTGVTEIQGGVLGTDDIRKLAMPMPYNPPSTVLFSLLGFLVDAGKGVVQTTFENLPDGSNPNMPVGTTLALIEQGLQVFSAIYQRMWTSMDNVIRVVHRIDRMYITDEEIKNDTGEFLAYRSDFQDPMDVVPTADREVFSEVQRYAQMQLVAQRAQTLPQLYDLRKVELMILKRSKIPDAEDLLLPAPQPQRLNAVNENLAMTLGRPVVAFPEQDHLAHIQVLLDFVTSPFLGMLPIIAPTFLPAALNHLKEHIAYWYVNSYFEIVSEEVGQELPEMDLGDIMKQYQDPETEKKIDEVLAVASPIVVKQAQARFAKVPDIIAKAQQLIQQFSPPQPAMDPATALLQKANIDSQSKDKDRSAKIQTTQMEMQDRQDARNAEAQRTAIQESGDDRRTAATNETRERVNLEDNTTAMRIAAAEIEAGHKSNLSTGTSVDKNPGSGVR